MRSVCFQQLSYLTEAFVVRSQQAMDCLLLEESGSGYVHMAARLKQCGAVLGPQLNGFNVTARSEQVLSRGAAAELSFFSVTPDTEMPPLTPLFDCLQTELTAATVMSVVFGMTILMFFGYSTCAWCLDMRSQKSKFDAEFEMTEVSLHPMTP